MATDNCDFQNDCCTVSCRPTTATPGIQVHLCEVEECPTCACDVTTAKPSLQTQVYTLPEIVLFEKCNDKSCGCNQDQTNRYCPPDCCDLSLPACQSFVIRVCGSYCTTSEDQVRLAISKGKCTNPVLVEPEPLSRSCGCVSFLFPEGLSAGWWQAQLIVDVPNQYRRVSCIDRFKLSKCMTSFDCCGTESDIKIN